MAVSKNSFPINTCWALKGTRNYFRVTHLGEGDRPHGIQFATGGGMHVVHVGVSIPIAMLYRITPFDFNREWIAFGLDLVNLHVPLSATDNKNESTPMKFLIKRSPKNKEFYFAPIGRNGKKIGLEGYKRIGGAKKAISRLKKDSATAEVVIDPSAKTK